MIKVGFDTKNSTFVLFYKFSMDPHWQKRLQWQQQQVYPLSGNSAHTYLRKVTKFQCNGF